jgi:hypothetical protein
VAGTGSGNITFNAAANPGAARIGTIQVGNAVANITQMALPTLSLSPSAGLQFSAALNSQQVLVTVTGMGPVTWTVSANRPWITVSPASGNGSGSFTVSVDPTGLSGQQTGTVTLTPTGVSTPAQTIPVTLDVQGSPTAAAPEFFLQNQATNAVSGWVMGGPNGATIQYAPLILTAAPGWAPAASADFDGNGWADIVLQNSTTWEVSIWYMGGPQGMTLLSAPVVRAAVPGWKVVAAGDFDGNGYQDIVLQNQTSNAVSIWYLGGANGLTLLSAPIIYYAVPGWRVVGSGDFDRSGVPDLILQNDTSNAVSVWYLGGTNGTMLLSAPVILTAAANWKVVGGSDVNADGTPDLVLQNASTNQVSVWYLGGTQGATVTSAPVIATAAPNWRMLATI